MKSAITCDAILTSASTRADGSLGLRFATPELAADEKTAFFELLNTNLKMLLQPEMAEAGTAKEVKGALANKTQSERIRGVLFVWYKQLGEPGEWETFYRHETEKFIEQVKGRLKPV